MIDSYPDRVAYLKDGWAVRFNGYIEAARWNSKGAAEAHLQLLQNGRSPQPELSEELNSSPLPKLYVYEVKEYEEYAAQVDKGIYVSAERAIEAAKDCILRQYEFRNKGPVPPISVIKYEGLTSNDWLVLTGDWTTETFEAWRWTDGDSFYWWYRPPFNHVGVVAVFRTEVLR